MYQMKDKEVLKIWKRFVRYDRYNEGSINLDSLYSMFSERSTSIIAPYLERFYELIDKKRPDQIRFDEFLISISAFCLFSRDEMVMFVFKMFDRDRDDYISKKDVFRHLMIERDKKMVYPSNNMRAVELFKCDRGDRIDKKLFLRLVTDVPYLIFPAFRL